MPASKYKKGSGKGSMAKGKGKAKPSVAKKGAKKMKRSKR